MSSNARIARANGAESVGAPLPSGTVTFAFTDIESSTQRWDRKASEMEQAVRHHDALLRQAILRHGGYVFKALGDAFCAAFSRPREAVEAMLDAQRSLAAQDFSELGGLRVRAAIHTGTADERDGDYFGPAVNRIARLLTVGHGGQVLVSGVTAAIVQDNLPAKVSLRDLGEHRLKDLALPERVYQLLAPDLAANFPPLRSLSELPTNLPLQLSSFVGRETEIAEIGTLVNNHRLVTLIGAGGVGKTRSALQVAANLLDDWDEGVWFVELASLSNGDHIPSAVTHALGVTLSTGAPLQTILEALKPKRALLLFDNCEHLVEPAARVIETILAGCPKVHVLASSRQTLEIAGERAYRLPSLELPKQDDVLRASDATQHSAIALFVERAAAVNARFTLTDESTSDTVEICRRLDGIPLAIELAASRISSLSVRQVLQMLDERFRLLTQKRSNRLPRQQTLRALIDWSYDLLGEEERAVFRRLSAFAGGWTLKAASAVCADDRIDEWQVFELLAGLVVKSLVVADPTDEGELRYHLLNSIREYSRERLAEANERDGVAAKHAWYYAGLLRELVLLVNSLEDEQWQHALAPELDNLRATLEWAIVGSNDTAAGFHLLAGLEWPELLTTPQEAVQWFDAAAAVTAAQVDDATKARVLRHRVRLEWLVGRPIAQREKSAMEALAIARASCDPDEIARSLANLGSCYRDAGRFDEAEQAFLQASRAEETLSPSTVNHVLRNWAVTNLQHGDVDEARRRFTQVAASERVGSEAHASALLNLGELEFALGNVEAARLAARKARETLGRLNAAPLALVVCNLAAYAMAVDDVADARELLAEALELLKKSGARWMINALEHHALLGGLTGKHERAAALLGFTEAHYGSGAKRERTERRGYERLIGLLSQIYGEGELEVRMSAGARLKAEQALEHAAAISQYT